MENNKNKKSVKFQGDMLNFCDFIQVFVFTRNHHLKRVFLQVAPSGKTKNLYWFPAAYAKQEQKPETYIAINLNLARKKYKIITCRKK